MKEGIPFTVSNSWKEREKWVCVLGRKSHKFEVHNDSATQLIFRYLSFINPAPSIYRVAITLLSDKHTNLEDN